MHLCLGQYPRCTILVVCSEGFNCSVIRSWSHLLYNSCFMYGQMLVTEVRELNSKLIECK